eukprot:NODE_1456_length_1137_cov_418.441774.p1 GENE.NODE_1456_length_1137_cov_418.441774~~NODE_1456_length_1137_cov_418.441774.p1  ORF type:complete len:328 (-),score=82.88 NODE_1456_length_1137_cov_418.441774:136-1119(-)
MGQGLIGSSKSLLWCVSLQGLLMFACGACLMMLLISDIEEVGSTANLPDDQADFIQARFPSLSQTLYTMHISALGGVDWNDVAWPLIQIDAGTGCVYVAYMTFAVLCMLNIITGIFVEKATKIMQQDLEQVMIEEASKRLLWFKQLADVFASTAKDSEDQVTDISAVQMNLKKFRDHILNDRVQAYLQRIGLEVDQDTAASVFNLVDFERTGELPLEEFLDGLERVAGTARQVDIYQQGRVVRKIQTDINKMTASLDVQSGHFATMQNTVTQLMRESITQSYEMAALRNRPNIITHISAQTHGNEVALTGHDVTDHSCMPDPGISTL